MDRRSPSPDSSNIVLVTAAGALAAVSSVVVFLAVASRDRRSRFQDSKELYIPSRSLGSEAGDSDVAKIPRTNSTADLVAPSLQPHPEGPNIGAGSVPNWFQKNSDLPPKTDLLHKGHRKGGKLLVVMVGLPGTGKTYISRKVARYLRWINYRTRAFSLARYRNARCGTGLKAEFYDTNDDQTVAARLEILAAAVEDMITYLLRAGEVAILDGTNFTKQRRQLIRDRAAQEDGFEILWIESICNDLNVVDQNLEGLKEFSPDFIDGEDFRQRLDYYRAAYETLETDEGSYVKSYDGGVRIEIHNAQGFVPTKITSFLMNLHVQGKPVFISRHGESMFNTQGLIGGDPPLSPLGEEYAKVLVDYVKQSEELPNDELCVWSSTMRRARQTAAEIDKSRYVEWRALREIEVGVCDGLTYAQVKASFPEEYRAREQDKLRYRYPRGESYLDIIARLEPVIFEMERQKAPLLIIAHQAVLRCLYAYFLDLPSEEIPYLSIPLHTVIKLTPQAFGCNEKRFKLLDDDTHPSA
ncbi:unnamed protein product [Ectocarpus sp. CCAP 1310/34]|nr:unnamed protein product [Ectocarpus sp. CCAP 1310/34]